MDRFQLMGAIQEATNLSVRRIGRSRKCWEIVRRVENPEWASLPQPRDVPRYNDETVDDYPKFPTETIAESYLMEIYRPIAEWWLLYAIIVAGKSARFAKDRMKTFLLFKPEDESPFEYIKSMGYNKTGAALRHAGTGNYKRILPAFGKVAGVEVYSWTLEKLEEVHGIGPKTSRFWLKVALGQYQYAVLDTHILKWLNYLGYRVPKSTPPNPKYEEIEKIFIAEAKERGMFPGTLDTLVWEFCNAGGPSDTNPWPEKLQRKEHRL